MRGPDPGKRIDGIDHGFELLPEHEFQYLMQLSHRLLVIFRGRIVADIPAGDFDPYRIGRLMTGGSI